jgi:hypothetical protein
MNAVALIVRHLELNSFEFRTGSIVAGFFSSKDRQTNLNIFSYQSTPAHRHTEELQATQGETINDDGTDINTRETQHNHNQELNSFIENDASKGTLAEGRGSV